ncbi:hypothetical protein BD779DRAFT_219311 [Infundibulicybe gibba]|nr:hypothetical protein BD779DRAFT_219311 [Infundibulicybe gibba]
MFIFPLVLLLASISTPAVSQGVHGLNDVRRGGACICNNTFRWPNSTDILSPDTKACSGTETLFIDHQQNQSTVTRNTVSSPPDGAVCVRLVDLSLLSRVLESPGGPCDQLQAKSSGTDLKEFEKLKKGFMNLVLQINNASNVIFVGAALESMKSHIIVDSLLGQSHNLTNIPALGVERIGAVSDYLAKTQGVSGPFVQRLDQAIAQSFPGTNATIEGAWIKALAFAKDVAQDIAGRRASLSARPSSSAGSTPSSAKPSSSAAMSSWSINPSFSATPYPSGSTPSSKAALSSGPIPSFSVNTPSSGPAPASSAGPSSDSDPKPSANLISSPEPSSIPASSSSASPSSAKPVSPNAEPSLITGPPEEYVVLVSDGRP